MPKTWSRVILSPNSTNPPNKTRRVLTWPKTCNDDSFLRIQLIVRLCVMRPAKLVLLVRPISDSNANFGGGGLKKCGGSSSQHESLLWKSCSGSLQVTNGMLIVYSLLFRAFSKQRLSYHTFVVILVEISNLESSCLESAQASILRHIDCHCYSAGKDHGKRGFRSCFIVQNPLATDPEVYERSHQNQGKAL